MALDGKSGPPRTKNSCFVRALENRAKAGASKRSTKSHEMKSEHPLGLIRVDSWLVVGFDHSKVRSPFG